MAQENLLYYSINTKIAFHINEKFYNHKHYVWCSPIFDRRKENYYERTSLIGPTSSPCEIYQSLLAEVKSEDRHSSKINENKNGLIKGATKQLEKGLITSQEFGRIKYLIDNAPKSDFSPFIYLIPKDKVAGRIIEVDPEFMATLLGVEYQITDLHRNEFEVIEL